MLEDWESLLREAAVPNPERAELHWAEYRAGGSGAEDAFRTLLVWYGLPLYRRIWGLVRSDGAEDILQDVLAKLHRHRAKLQTWEHAQRWLRTVAVRDCIQLHKQTAHRRTLLLKKPVAEGYAVADAEFERQEVIAVALSKLPEKYREMIALVFFEGLTKQAAAAVLNLDRDTVASRLKSALEQLQHLVPLPMVVALGGTVGMQQLLNAKPGLPNGRLGEIGGKALAKVAAGGAKVGRTTAIIALGVSLAGTAVAGWVASRHEEPPSPVRERPAAEVLETVPERTLREFHDRVKPTVQAALGKLTPNGGVELIAASAANTCVTAEFMMKATPQSTAATSPRLVLWYDTQTRKSRVLIHLFGAKEGKVLDPDRPLIWYRDETAKKDWVQDVPPLRESLQAFDRLSKDGRTEAESANHHRCLKAALKPWLGEWYRAGNRVEHFVLRFDDDGTIRYGAMILALPSEIQLRDDGTVSLTMADLSADGTKLNQHSPPCTWHREPK